MLVHKVESFRYYSYLADFDFIVVLESECNFDARLFIEDIIESWFEYSSEVGDIPLTEYIINEFERKKVCISLYFSLDGEEEC